MELEESTCLTSESESESEVAQSCPTLFDPMDGDLPGSAVHGIFQARIYNGEKTIALTSGAGKLVNDLQNNETRTLSNTIHKNKLKMD